MNPIQKRRRNPYAPPLTPWLRNPPKQVKKHAYTIRGEYEAPPGSLAAHPDRGGKLSKRGRGRKLRFPPPPLPTTEQVDEFALAIAISDDNIVDPHILRLIVWKPGKDLSGIPKRTLDKHFHAALRRWDKAWLLLKQCMEDNHVLMIRNVRRHGNRVRTRYWTAAPLKHGRTPPPRRRMFIPPIILERLSAGPPGGLLPAEAPLAENPPACGCRREDALFGPGGGHRHGALRPRPGGTPSPNAPPRSLTIEEYADPPREGMRRQAFSPVPGSCPAPSGGARNPASPCRWAWR